ncbi:MULTISPECIES: CS1 type fimbrial major subunit [Rahnella]|uniref:Fimbrial assembly protein n=1 Tax=Rahnella laticis TaxID=2787622 RepID=A0ABS0E277_9GAMM|nr:MULTISPECIES: CS1 type fimbrial major subunit [Rahnella]MBF7979198.1 fimbrial assembly protein [Rahnella laticis]MBF7999537.1 fimbrial assembly protein [Rahnella sp. LAC-M12]
MKHIFKTTLLSALLLSAFATQAVQRNITVTAVVDPTVDMTLADGSALPDALTMEYNVVTGLQPISQQVKLWTNSTTANLNISLASAVNLASGTTQVPLTVKLDGKTLTTTATALTYATYFPNGNTTGSLAVPLEISQTTAGALKTAGTYTGTVGLVLAQATSN